MQLNTGQTASALFEGLTGPLPGDSPCPPYNALVITPPNETHPANSIPSTFSLCYLEIHPIASSITGKANAP